MMKLGIIAEEYTLEYFQQIKDRGLECVEFCIYSNDSDPNRHINFLEKLDEIKANLQVTGLFVASVGRWGGIKLIENSGMNEVEIKIDKMLIDATAKLGAPVYVTGCNYIEATSLFDNYRNTIGYFNYLVEYGKSKGIKIAVHNSRWNNYIVSYASWSAILSNVKDLYIKYNPSHCIYNGDDYLNEMAKWGNRIIHIHLTGSLRINGERYDDPPAGLDETNWPAFFATLYAIGYDKNLCIEANSNSSTWNGALYDKGIQYTIDYMKKFIL
ncbi:MAG: hypothetical protein ATN31_07790 [Candidatus Epulonipiscioides saccharophilum]|nr:MAG: hypothetical protein ATN31_07790 [Epulopiscium sp. AS2M-Bin001]